MHTETATIGNLLRSRAPFVVPKYQRAYAWDTEELNDFVADLQGLLDARLINATQPKKHFLGGLVSILNDVPGVSPNMQYEVVDGQQRLATCSLVIGLLIEAFRKVAEEARIQGDKDTFEEGNELIAETQREFTHYTERSMATGKGTQKLRLTLSKPDRTYFEQLVDGRTPPAPSRDSHRRLMGAYRTISSGLIAPICDDPVLLPKDKLQRLLALRLCICDDCYGVHIYSESRDEAYELFTVLNDRGKSLSDGDLLRTHTLGLLREDSPEQIRVEQDWDTLLRWDNNTIDSFLRAYYPSITGKRAPKRDLFKTYKEQFFNFTSSPPTGGEADLIEGRVRDLREQIEYFTKITSGEWPYDSI